MRKPVLAAAAALVLLFGCFADTFVVRSAEPQTIANAARARTAAGIPVRLVLDAAGFQTVVIEDSQGNRVRNLIAETRFPAGETTLYWDGLDDGGRGRTGNRRGSLSPRVHTMFAV